MLSSSASDGGDDETMRLHLPHLALGALPQSVSAEYAFSIFSSEKEGTGKRGFCLNADGLMRDSKNILLLSFGHGAPIPHHGNQITNPPLPTTITSCVMQRAAIMDDQPLPPTDNHPITLNDIIATPASMAAPLLPSGYLLSLVIDNPFAIGSFLGNLISTLARHFCYTFQDISPILKRLFIQMCVKSPLVADCMFVTLARLKVDNLTQTQFLDFADQFFGSAERIGIIIPPTKFDVHVRQQLILQWQIIVQHTAIIFPQIQRLFSQQIDVLRRHAQDPSQQQMLDEIVQIHEEKLLKTMQAEAVKAANASVLDDNMIINADGPTAANVAVNTNTNTNVNSSPTNTSSSSNGVSAASSSAASASTASSLKSSTSATTTVSAAAAVAAAVAAITSNLNSPVLKDSTHKGDSTSPGNPQHSGNVQTPGNSTLFASSPLLNPSLKAPTGLSLSAMPARRSFDAGTTANGLTNTNTASAAASTGTGVGTGTGIGANPSSFTLAPNVLAKPLSSTPALSLSASHLRGSATLPTSLSTGVGGGVGHGIGGSGSGSGSSGMGTSGPSTSPTASTLAHAVSVFAPKSSTFADSTAFSLKSNTFSLSSSMPGDASQRTPPLSHVALTPLPSNVLAPLSLLPASSAKLSTPRRSLPGTTTTTTTNANSSLGTSIHAGSTASSTSTPTTISASASAAAAAAVSHIARGGTLASVLAMRAAQNNAGGAFNTSTNTNAGTGTGAGVTVTGTLAKFAPALQGASAQSGHSFPLSSHAAHSHSQSHAHTHGHGHGVGQGHGHGNAPSHTLTNTSFSSARGGFTNDAYPYQPPTSSHSHAHDSSSLSQAHALAHVSMQGQGQGQAYGSGSAAHAYTHAVNASSGGSTGHDKGERGERVERVEKIEKVEKVEKGRRPRKQREAPVIEHTYASQRHANTSVVNTNANTNTIASTVPVANAPVSMVTDLASPLHSSGLMAAAAQQGSLSSAQTSYTASYGMGTVSSAPSRDDMGMITANGHGMGTAAVTNMGMGVSTHTAMEWSLELGQNPSLTPLSPSSGSYAFECVSIPEHVMALAPTHLRKHNVQPLPVVSLLLSSQWDDLETVVTAVLTKTQTNPMVTLNIPSSSSLALALFPDATTTSTRTITQPLLHLFYLLEPEFALSLVTHTPSPQLVAILTSLTDTSTASVQRVIADPALKHYYFMALVAREKARKRSEGSISTHVYSRPNISEFDHASSPLLSPLHMYMSQFKNYMLFPSRDGKGDGVGRHSHADLHAASTAAVAAAIAVAGGGGGGGGGGGTDVSYLTDASLRLKTETATETISPTRTPSLPTSISPSASTTLSSGPLALHPGELMTYTARVEGVLSYAPIVHCLLPPYPRNLTVEWAPQQHHAVAASVADTVVENTKLETTEDRDMMKGAIAAYMVANTAFKRNQHTPHMTDHSLPSSSTSSGMGSSISLPPSLPLPQIRPPTLTPAFSPHRSLLSRLTHLHHTLLEPALTSLSLSARRLVESRTERAVMVVLRGWGQWWVEKYERYRDERSVAVCAVEEGSAFVTPTPASLPTSTSSSTFTAASASASTSASVSVTHPAAHLTATGVAGYGIGGSGAAPVTVKTEPTGHVSASASPSPSPSPTSSSTSSSSASSSSASQSDVAVDSTLYASDSSLTSTSTSTSSSAELASSLRVSAPAALLALEAVVLLREMRRLDTAPAILCLCETNTPHTQHSAQITQSYSDEKDEKDEPTPADMNASAFTRVHTRTLEQEKARGRVLRQDRSPSNIAHQSENASGRNDTEQSNTDHSKDALERDNDDVSTMDDIPALEGYFTPSSSPTSSSTSSSATSASVTNSTSALVSSTAASVSPCVACATIEDILPLVAECTHAPSSLSTSTSSSSPSPSSSSSSLLSASNDDLRVCVCSILTTTWGTGIAGNGVSLLANDPLSAPPTTSVAAAAGAADVGINTGNASALDVHTNMYAMNDADVSTHASHALPHARILSASQRECVRARDIAVCLHAHLHTSAVHAIATHTCTCKADVDEEAIAVLQLPYPSLSIAAVDTTSGASDGGMGICAVSNTAGSTTATTTTSTTATNTTPVSMCGGDVEAKEPINTQIIDVNTITSSLRSSSSSSALTTSAEALRQVLPCSPRCPFPRLLWAVKLLLSRLLSLIETASALTATCDTTAARLVLVETTSVQVSTQHLISALTSHAETDYFNLFPSPTTTSIRDALFARRALATHTRTHARALAFLGPALSLAAGGRAQPATEAVEAALMPIATAATAATTVPSTGGVGVGGVGTGAETSTAISMGTCAGAGAGTVTATPSTSTGTSTSTLTSAPMHVTTHAILGFALQHRLSLSAASSLMVALHPSLPSPPPILASLSSFSAHITRAIAPMLTQPLSLTAHILTPLRGPHMVVFASTLSQQWQPQLLCIAALPLRHHAPADALIEGDEAVMVSEGLLYQLYTSVLARIHHWAALAAPSTHDMSAEEIEDEQMLELLHQEALKEEIDISPSMKRARGTDIPSPSSSSSSFIATTALNDTTTSTPVTTVPSEDAPPAAPVKGRPGRKRKQPPPQLEHALVPPQPICLASQPLHGARPGIWAITVPANSALSTSITQQYSYSSAEARTKVDAQRLSLGVDAHFHSALKTLHDRPSCPCNGKLFDPLSALPPAEKLTTTVTPPPLPSPPSLARPGVEHPIALVTCMRDDIHLAVTTSLLHHDSVRLLVAKARILSTIICSAPALAAAFTHECLRTDLPFTSLLVDKPGEWETTMFMVERVALAGQQINHVITRQFTVARWELQNQRDMRSWPDWADITREWMVEEISTITPNIQAHGTGATLANAGGSGGSGGLSYHGGAVGGGGGMSDDACGCSATDVCPTHASIAHSDLNNTHTHTHTHAHMHTHQSSSQPLAYASFHANTNANAHAHTHPSETDSSSSSPQLPPSEMWLRAHYALLHVTEQECEWLLEMVSMLRGLYECVSVCTHQDRALATALLQHTLRYKLNYKADSHNRHIPPDILSQTTRTILNTYTPTHMDVYLADNKDIDQAPPQTHTDTTSIPLSSRRATTPSATASKTAYIDPVYYNCPCDESIRSSATIVRVRCSPTCLFARVLRYHLLSATSIKEMLSLTDETVLLTLLFDLRTKKLEWLPQQERVRAYARALPFLVEWCVRGEMPIRYGNAKQALANAHEVRLACYTPNHALAGSESARAYAHALTTHTLDGCDDDIDHTMRNPKQEWTKRTQGYSTFEELWVTGGRAAAINADNRNQLSTGSVPRDAALTMAVDAINAASLHASHDNTHTHALAHAHAHAHGVGMGHGQGHTLVNTGATQSSHTHTHPLTSNHLPAATDMNMSTRCSRVDARRGTVTAPTTATNTSTAATAAAGGSAGVGGSLASQNGTVSPSLAASPSIPSLMSPVLTAIRPFRYFYVSSAKSGLFRSSVAFAKLLPAMAHLEARSHEITLAQRKQRHTTSYVSSTRGRARAEQRDKEGACAFVISPLVESSMAAGQVTAEQAMVQLYTNPYDGDMFSNNTKKKREATTSPVSNAVASILAASIAAQTGVCPQALLMHLQYYQQLPSHTLDMYLTYTRSLTSPALRFAVEVYTFLMFTPDIDARVPERSDALICGSIGGIEHANIDTLAWWREHTHIFPTMAPVARHALSVVTALPHGTKVDPVAIAAALRLTRPHVPIADPAFTSTSTSASASTSTSTSALGDGFGINPNTTTATTATVAPANTNTNTNTNTNITVATTAAVAPLRGRREWQVGNIKQYTYSEHAYGRPVSICDVGEVLLKDVDEGHCEMMTMAGINMQVMQHIGE